MVFRLKPTDYFFDMCRLCKETMLFRRGDYGVAIFLWMVCWLLPSLVLGWYLADICLEDP